MVECNLDLNMVLKSQKLKNNSAKNAGLIPNLYIDAFWRTTIV